MKPTDFLASCYKDNPALIVDVGARAGFRLLPALHEFAEVHLLEPDPKAAEELRSLSAVAFRKSNVHELALGKHSGNAKLHLTAHASMNSLLNPAMEEFTRGFGEIKNAPDWGVGMKVNATIDVKTDTLGDFVTTNTISHIDFLKLDTQGNELDILKSGESLLSNGRVGVICTEVSFFPVYEKQSYFSEIDVFLRACGFRLVELRSYPHVLEREDEFSAGSKLYERPKKAPVGDAWYVFNWKNSDTATHNQRIRAANILACEGYFSEAKYLLGEAIAGEERNELFGYLSAPNRESGFRHFLRRWTPPAIQQWRAKRRK